MNPEEVTELLIYRDTINLWIEETSSRSNPTAARNLLAHYCQCIERGQQQQELAQLILLQFNTFGRTKLNPFYLVIDGEH